MPAPATHQVPLSDDTALAPAHQAVVLRSIADEFPQGSSQNESLRRLEPVPSAAERRSAEYIVRPLVTSGPEIEAQFFIPLDALTEMINLESLPQREIRQTQISPKDAHLAAHLMTFMGAGAIVDDNFNLSQARVRKVIYGDADTIHCYFQCKGTLPQSDAAKAAGEPEIRTEISCPLHPQLYDTLERVFGNGTVLKKRFVVEGELQREDRSHPLKAEIDILLGAGPSGEPLPEKARAFALVDIELPDTESFLTLREGKHSFRFLDSAIEITDGEHPSADKHLGMKRLAKKGWSKNAEAAHDALTEEWYKIFGQ